MKKKPIRPQKKTGILVYGDAESAADDTLDFKKLKVDFSGLKEELEKLESVAAEHIRNDTDPVGKIIKQKTVKKLVIESDGTTKNTHLFIDGVEIVGCSWIIFEADEARPVISLNLKLMGVAK